jgi:hypothetical protein
MASVVYHREFLRRELLENHPLFFTPLFANLERLEMLSKLVQCRLQQDDDPIVATGIPFNVSFLVAMSKLQDGLKMLVPAVKDVVSDGMDRIANELEQRGVNSGALTPHVFQQRLDESLDHALARSGITQFMQRFQHVEEEKLDEEGTEGESDGFVHYQNGRFYRFPPSFNVPCVALLLAFRLYCCGSKKTNFIPLRKLQGADFSSKNKQKRFAEYKFVMSLVEERLRSTRHWIEEPTTAQANAMFQQAEDVFSAITTTRTGKKRRLGQISWSTAAKELRKLRVNDSVQ